jgi:hypothetical protein
MENNNRIWVFDVAIVTTLLQQHTQFYVCCACVFCGDILLARPADPYLEV